jgi:hypothetical protein
MLRSGPLDCLVGRGAHHSTSSVRIAPRLEHARGVCQTNNPEPPTYGTMKKLAHHRATGKSGDSSLSGQWLHQPYRCPHSRSAFSTGPKLFPFSVR